MCHALSGGSPVRAAELRIGVPRLPATLDPPAIASASGDAGLAPMLLRLMLQGLVEFGERGDIGPGLAAQWGVSRDGLTWTFRLRAGPLFHNGAPLTADDVVLSLGRHVSGEEPPPGTAPWARLFRGPARLVREIRSGEAGSVQIQLGQPFSPLLAILAHPALGITLAREDGDGRPLGTGPYRLAEQGPGRLVLEAARGGRGEPPRTERLVFLEIADDAAGVAGLGPGGALDAYFPQAPPGWGGLGLQVLSAPSSRIGLLAVRSDQGLSARKAVRQAIGLALDPGLLQPALGRWASPHGSWLPPGAWGARDAPAAAHDPARARRLLGQAGATDAQLTLLAAETPSGPDLARLAEAIQLSLAPAGLRVRVRLEPEEAAAPARSRGDADLALLEAAQLVNDPHFFWGALLGSEAALVGSATNVAFFRSPLVDGMLFRASQLAFRPERLRLYQRLQAHLAEEAPYVPLYARLQWIMARPSVRGLRLEPGGLHRLERAWIEGEAAPGQ